MPVLRDFAILKAVQRTMSLSGALEKNWLPSPWIAVSSCTMRLAQVYSNRFMKPCLAKSLADCGLFVERQKIIPIRYYGVVLDEAFRADVVDENHLRSK